MALTYHFHHNVISCACGKLITGSHTCDTQVTKIEVVVCNYISRFSKTNEQPCEICLVKEQEQRYEEQWEHDDSGCPTCAECEDRCDYGLPKRCSCAAFIDIDGKSKCKKCKKLWTEPYLNFGECGECGYEGYE